MSHRLLQVSVALCTYNGARHLPAQLESIRSQTQLPFEVVVCDDVSTDTTAAIVEEFARGAPFPVRLFRNAANLGSTRNFEQAIRLCQGDIIALCDQDDVWEPGKLGRMATILEHEPQLAGIFSNAYLIDDAGVRQPGDLWQRFGFSQRRQRHFTGPDAAVQLALRDTVTGATFLFRASWLDQLLPIPPEYVHDGWIALLLASMSELRALPTCTMSYRLHAAQQIGATHISLPGYVAVSMGTPVEKALQFHRAYLRRKQLMLERLQMLSEQPPSRGRMPDARVLAVLARRIQFVQARIDLLCRSRMRRLLPALALIPGYFRYEKGLLSMLRDLAHADRQHVAEALQNQR